MVPDDPLVALALRVTDGESIDWNAEIERESVAPSLVRGLQQIDAVARAHEHDTPTETYVSTGRPEVVSRLPSGSYWGHLEIIELIGSGSYGAVYRARDTRLGRDVALKLLRTRDVVESGASFLVREGHLLSRVKHANVVTVHGADCIDGRTGLWMELIEGETLGQEVRRRGAFAAAEVAQIGAVLSDALEAVHSAGLLHRDVKAQNVMRDRSGRLVLMDFGSGRDAQRFSGSTVEGTPLYAAPEVLNGGEASVRSDIYSLGVLLWYLLTGGYPVNGRSADEIRRAHGLGRVAQKEGTRTEGGIARIALECLAFDPKERPPTAGELGKHLRECTQASGWRRRSIRNASALGAFAAAVLLLATVPLRLRLSADVPSPSATGEPIVLPITANPPEKTLTSAYMSPDGRYLAYADSTGLHVRVIDTGETHELAETENMNVYGWNADSESLFASRCDLQCVGWVIPLAGQERRSTDATWQKDDSVKASPDGKRLLKRERFKPLIVDPMNGGPEIRLSEGFVNAASWSPDGTRIVFVKDASYVRTVSAEGGVPREVFRAPANRFIYDVLELSDGSILISIGPPTDTAALSTAFELWKLRPDGKEVSRKITLTLSLDSFVLGLTASRNGDRVAFLSYLFQRDVYVADCDLRRGVLQKPRRLTLDDRQDTSWAWMPDSGAVIISSDRNGNEDIFALRLDTGIAEPLVTGPGHQDFVRVTGDGYWLLYRDVSRSAPHTERIMRVPLAGGGVPELVHNFPMVGDRRGFHCAAHGRCIAYESQDENLLLSTLDPIQGMGSELARIPKNTRGAYVLPDGDSYGYIPADKGFQNHVRIISFLGAPSKDIIVQHATALDDLVWLPSNSGFLTTDKGNLLLVSYDGSSRVLWSPAPLTALWAQASPDEKHLAITVGSIQENAWMVSGF